MSMESSPLEEESEFASGLGEGPEVQKGGVGRSVGEGRRY